MNRVHVIGAGLAGLAAALTLTRAGRAVTVYEAGPVAGGRCRSYVDRELGIRIDNGNHLILSGNRATFGFVDEIGTRAHFPFPAAPAFPFVDMRTEARWVLRPNAGRIPWWALVPSRRVPGTHLAAYLELNAVARLNDDTTVAEALTRGRLYWHLVEPLAVAALNTPPQVGLARLLGAVLRESLMRGGHACLPTFPRQGLSGALIDPAVALLRERGAELHTGRRVAALGVTDDRVTSLTAGGETIAVDDADTIVLAVPAWVAHDLLPPLTVPDQHESIINVHYLFDHTPTGAVAQTGFVGVVDGFAQWVFVKPGHVSVTISAANQFAAEAPGVIAARAWRDVCAALELGAPAMPVFRVVRERRATFAATADQERRRPPPQVGLRNLAVAGDWTATGLPATIEGAIRSGRRAAAVLLGQGDRA